MKSSNLIWIFLLVPLFAQRSTAQMNPQNASDFVNMEPLAGLDEIRSSKEMYMVWAQGNLFKQQIVDYFPTNQSDASLLAGKVSDVFVPSTVENGTTENGTTRSAALAADLNSDGLDEIVRLSTDQSFDLILSVTEVGSELEITGSTITTNISAGVSKNLHSQVQLHAGNFDDDAAEEVVAIWARGDNAQMDQIVIKIFDLQEGRLQEIHSYVDEGAFSKYDAVLADLDLNGTPEISIAKLTSDLIVEVKSCGIKNEMFEELVTQTVDEFSDGEAITSDLALSMSAGDYDGDVAPELALTFQQLFSNPGKIQIQLRILQAFDISNNAEQNIFEALIATENISVVDTALEFAPIYTDIFMASGDVDGNGNDDLIIHSPTRNLFYLLPLDSLSDRTVSRLGFSGGQNDDPIFCFTRGGAQVVDMCIDDLNRDGIDELVYVEAEGCTEDIISDNMRGARLTVDVYDLSNGEATLTGSYNSNESNTEFFGVLAADFVLGDFNGDNFRLGQGRFFRKSELSQPIIILNAPPIHFDVLGGNTFDVNGCFDGNSCDFSSTYFRSSTMSAQTSTTISSAWSVGATVSASGGVDAVVVKSTLEASVSARYGEKFSKYRSSGRRIEISTEVSAVEDDQIYATVTDYDIWEYPILEGDSIVGHLISITPTVSERRWFPSKSYNAFDYLPDHEVGNILSYREKKPRLSNIAQNISSDEFTLSANSNNKWTVNQQSFQNSGSSFEQEIGLEASVTVENEAQFKVFGGSLEVTLEGEYEASTLSTQKTRVSEELEIEIELGGVDESLGEVKYAVQPYCYWAKNGALVVDYTTQPEVPAPGASDTWWSENYGKQADPALILPWQYDPEKGLTLQDEQVKRFQSKSIAFSNDRPNPGDTITIFVEVHNWSLIPTAEPVEVGFYLCDPMNEQNRLIGINGGSTISSGGVLDPRGNEIISFEWQVPEGLPTFPRIYARLDPSNRESEIHEENNFGFNILNISTNRAPCPPPEITSNHNFTKKLEAFMVYPNPTKDYLWYDFESPKPGTLIFEIFDAFGTRVYHSREKINSGDISHKVMISLLPAGMYYYRAGFSEYIANGSFVKM